MIAEKYDQERLLSEKSGDSFSYSISKDLVINPTDPNDSNMQFEDIRLQRWATQQWTPMTIESPVKLTNGSLSIPIKGLEKGFYRIDFISVGKNHRSGHQYYFLVSSDWKNEIMGICQRLKRKVEVHTNAHEIGASIVISHFTNLQEKVSLSRSLSGEILSRLALAIQSKNRFEQGDIPDFSIGLNKLRFKRFEGVEYADFVLKIPPNYNNLQKWPLLIVSDRYRDNTKKGYVGVHGGPQNVDMPILYWHSISLNDLQWKDFCLLYQIIRSKLNIDHDRIYLFGYCGCGMEAMALAVHYPDQWTELLFSTGNSHRNLAENVHNIPVTYSNVHGEDSGLIAYVNFTRKCFEYHKCPKFRYIESSDWADHLKQKKFSDIKCKNPIYIDFTMENSQVSKAYWLAILGREDDNFIAHINVVVEGQTIVLTRENVDAYQLDLKQAPLDHALPMTIIDNGKSIDVDPQEVYSYLSAKYDRAKLFKNNRLHGPIYDVFTDAYTVFYTPGDDKKQTKQIAAIARKIAGTGPCMPESKLSKEILQNQNIVAVGKAKQSEILNQVSKYLPLQFQDDTIIFDGQTISGDAGIAMVYPNPLNPQKYIALILADSDLSLGNIANIWENKLADAKVDVAIFKVKANNQYDLVRFEKFNTVWNWHTHWNQQLASVLKEYPKWRWRQWVGHAIRTQMDAEVVVSEEVFKTDGIPNYQSITPRVLSQTIENQWIVKIKLKGSELKNLLMKSVGPKTVFDLRKEGGKPSGLGKDPIVEGVSFIKGMTESDCIHISDIKSDQYYTLAMPYKPVADNRIGGMFMPLNDYEIVGDGYLLPMLNDYLRNRESVELDCELEKMKLNIL